jgi:hypothetical protein
MNLRLAAAVLFPVLLMCRPHLTVATAGLSLTVPVWLIAVLAVGLACLALAILAARALLAFAYPRPRAVT